MATIAPQVVGTPTFGDSNNGVSASLTIPKPSGVQNGDILVAVLRCGSSSQASDYSLAGWTRRAWAFAGSNASARVSGTYTHYVTNAGSEPASYVFALAGNSFARQAGVMFIVRPGTGADPWGTEPTYSVAPSFTAGPPPYAPASGTQAVTANSLVIYGGGNETTSPSAATWTPPTGATSIGVHGSLTNQSDTSATRSVAAAAYEVVAGTAAGGSGKSLTFPVISSAVAMLMAIPGTEQSAVNTAPAAAFTFSVSNLTASVDGSSSSDAEGAVASYSWAWGDGTAASTGATASHTYASAGTYSVTLTVTDAGGLTNSTTKSVTVTAPNTAPVAAFTSSVSNLTVSFDGSGSSDAEGSIASYSWVWGDGTANGSGATPTHTYAAAGTYTVALTVTDAGGLTNTVSHTVTVTAPPTGGANHYYHPPAGKLAKRRARGRR